MSENISDSILIARQPIFDSKLNVYAYELLFRGSLKSDESGVDEFNGDLATSQVIHHTFMEFGIDRVIGNKRAFINLTHSFITGEIPIPFDHNQVVLEILEDVVIDEQVIKAVEGFVSQGFIIALDDFIYSEEWQPLVKMASIIKLDILSLTKQELIDSVERLKHEDIILLAEKVETEEQYKLCQQLGFTYFQGYFFCKPTIINDKPLPENKRAVLEILHRLQDPDITIDELELLVKEDVSLSFKLIRFLNSAAVALPKKVDSVRQGLVFLGLNAIKSWATVIAFSDMESTTSELMTTALIRAKLCQQLASAFDADEDSAFMIGLFSPLAAILQKPMVEILNSLPIETEMKDALLLKGNSPLSKLLLFVISHEQNTLTELPNQVSIQHLNTAYLATTEWVTMAESAL
ncbi:MAG: HDOD domain-containing protein [Gammaproteobacteria bacterium]|nr:HDOD domain-containing protein [Gammaproteobacteria bacterium]